MKKMLIALALVIMPMLTGAFLITDMSHAQDTKAAICDGIKATGANCNQKAENKIDNVVAVVINIFSWIVGVVAVIFVILGGFKYITSGGDSNKVSSAKNTIIYAIIGLVIVALAQVIVIFVLNQVTPPPAP